VFRRLAEPDGGLKGFVLTAAQRDQLAIADRSNLHRSFLRFIDVGKNTSAHAFEDLPASGRGGGVLDKKAGSPAAWCGLPARVRSER
jgi:hypothetical protein